MLGAMMQNDTIAWSLVTIILPGRKAGRNNVSVIVVDRDEGHDIMSWNESNAFSGTE